MGVCREGDNNYLAPLEVASNSSYLLLINHFGRDSSIIELQLGGTAEADCMTNTTLEDNNNDSPFTVKQTPSHLLLHPATRLNDATVHLSTTAVQVVLPRTISGEAPIAIDYLSSKGLYFITVKHEKQMWIE